MNPFGVWIQLVKELFKDVIKTMAKDKHIPSFILKS